MRLRDWAADSTILAVRLRQAGPRGWGPELGSSSCSRLFSTSSSPLLGCASGKNVLRKAGLASQGLAAGSCPAWGGAGAGPSGVRTRTKERPNWACLLKGWLQVSLRRSHFSPRAAARKSPSFNIRTPERFLPSFESAGVISVVLGSRVT